MSPPQDSAMKAIKAKKAVMKAKKLIEMAPTPVTMLVGALSCSGVAFAVFQYRRSTSGSSEEPLLIYENL